MEVDYSKGRYVVVHSSGRPIGRIDEDEFVRQGSALLFRIDGTEVFDVNTGRLLGHINSGKATKPNGQELFFIHEE